MKAKSILVAAAVAVGASSIAYGGYTFLISEGRAELEKMAREAGYCGADPNCNIGIRTAAATVIVKDVGYTSEEQIHWCLGIESLTDTNVRRGRWLLDLVASGLYLRCPEPEA